tara:strand:+ start:6192 stop:6824 length:633 start_codon:yes stop_codon:yes gene_type:complete
VATEVEIKLAFKEGLSDSRLDALESVLKDLGCHHRYAKKELKNAYFDTPDFSLHQHKVALRIRQSLNDQGKLNFIQTFKTAGKSVDGLSQRGEWEWTLPEHKLDTEQLQQCEAWPTGVTIEKLVTLFETNFVRYVFDVRWQDSLVELVLDWGEILSNNKHEKIHEIELELKQGNQYDLKSLAQILTEKLPLYASDMSKAERGVKLFQMSK